MSFHLPIDVILKDNISPNGLTEVLLQIGIEYLTVTQLWILQSKIKKKRISGEIGERLNFYPIKYKDFMLENEISFHFHRLKRLQCRNSEAGQVKRTQMLEENY